MSYKAVSFRSVCEAVVRRRGYRVDTATLTAAERGRVADLINTRLREAWELEWWAELCTVEQRQYRETYDVTDDYEAGDEVYSGGHYYRSLQDGNIGNAVTNDTWWELADDDLERTIALEQEWEDQEIGSLDVQIHLFDRDPRLNPDSEPLRNCYLMDGAIYVRADQAPVRPWVFFRLPCPEFSWTEWDAATDYAVGDVVFLTSSGATAVGEAFRALRANTNKDPYTQTDDWVQVDFPLFLRDYVLHAVAAEDREEDEARFRDQARAREILEALQDRMQEGRGYRRRAVWGRG